MRNGQSQRAQYMFEIMFSINLALAAAAFFFLGPDSVSAPLFRMNDEIYRLLHLLPDVKVPKDSYNAGYFALLLLACVLAGGLWAVFRAASREELLRGFLQLSAGISALGAAPSWWIIATYIARQKDGWKPFASVCFYELVLVIALAMFYTVSRRRIPYWVAIAISALHYGFWLWQFGTHLYFLGYGGPVAPTAGFCAAVTWIFYLERLPWDRQRRVHA